MKGRYKMPRKTRIDNRPRKRQQPGYVDPRLISMKGQIFGLWTVLGTPSRNEIGQTTWLCRCDCGTERVVVAQTLRQGKTNSCGCRKGDGISKARTTHGASGGALRISAPDVSESSTHGGDRKEKVTPVERVRKSNYQLAAITYKRWLSMRKRVADKSEHVFKYYGAKGIKVCDRWQTYENFLADMGECPTGLTLDRLDPNRDYEPGNCRWATWAQQHRQRTMMEVCPQCGKQRVTCGAERLAT